MYFIFYKISKKIWDIIIVPDFLDEHEIMTDTQHFFIGTAIKFLSLF